MTVHHMSFGFGSITCHMSFNQVTNRLEFWKLSWHDGTMYGGGVYMEHCRLQLNSGYFSVWLYRPKPNKQLKLQTGICTAIIFQAVIWIAPIFIVGNFATDWTWGETRYKIWYSPQQRIYCTVVVDTICTYGIYHNCAKYKCNKPRYLHTHYPT